MNETPALSKSSSEDGSEGAEDSLERGREVDPMEIVYSREEETKEPTTGILYPAGINQYKLIGCGVRTKYYILHAYTIGLYMDVDVKKGDNIRDLLLDPAHPKVFRVVMNMYVTSRLYMGAIYEALTPLMNGQDMDK